jgi:predicted phage terminase large subunit-like protein
MTASPKSKTVTASNQSWDTASKSGPDNDWSVGTTWLYKDGIYYLVDLYREKLIYTDLRAAVIDLARAYDPHSILIEDTGIGTGLLEDLRCEGFNAVDVQPTKSKEARAHIQTHKFEASRVLFPREAPWLSELEARRISLKNSRLIGA